MPLQCGSGVAFEDGPSGVFAAHPAGIRLDTSEPPLLILGTQRSRSGQEILLECPLGAWVFQVILRTASFSGDTPGKEPACQCRRCGFEAWIGKIPWRRAWQPLLQYSCLENPLNRGAWQATVHRVTENQTQLRWLSTRVHRRPHYALPVSRRFLSNGQKQKYVEGHSSTPVLGY